MPVKVESPDLAEMLRTLQAASKDAPKAFRLAMNGARAKVKADTAVQAGAIYNVPEKRIAKDLKPKPIDGFTFVIIGGKGRRPPSLIAYGAEQNARGLLVTVKKKRGPRLIRSAFIANGWNGNRLPFLRFGPKRVMKKGRYQGKLRQPLFALYGPSVADMVTNNEVYNPIKARFVTVVSDDLTKRIKRALKRG